jgi:ActR/RegA family two-component response regulator
MSGRSFLIIEDDHGAADALLLMLTARGYDVRFATDAEAGLREIERSQPAVLVVDLRTGRCLPGVAIEVPNIRIVCSSFSRHSGSDIHVASTAVASRVPIHADV